MPLPLDFRLQAFSKALHDRGRGFGQEELDRFKAAFGVCEAMIHLRCGRLQRSSKRMQLLRRCRSRSGASLGMRRSRSMRRQCLLTIT